MGKLSQAALKARRKYYRDYNQERRKDPDKVKHDKDYLKIWRQHNPEKVKNYLVSFWGKRANKTTVTDNVTDKNILPDNSTATNNSNKTCAVCGVAFTPRRKGAKYCGPACKQKHYRNLLKR